MALQKFLTMVAGRFTQVSPISTSSGSGDGEKLVATGADGKLDPTLMPDGVGADAKTFTASEALSANDLVNLWNDSGTVKMRKADASAEGKEADGYVKGAVSSGATGSIYFDGTNSGLTGLTKGARYYLSAATPGAITDTAPSADGNVVQFVGKAISATELSFEPGEPVTV